MPSPVHGAKLNIQNLLAATLACLLVACASKEEIFDRNFKQANDMVNAGEFTAAIEILVPLNQERPDFMPVVEALAFAYAGDGDHTLAAWHMIQLADLDPSQPDLRLLAAESLETAGDPNAAIEQYRIYLKKDSQDSQAWNHLAGLYRQTGNTRGAVEALLSKQTLDPSEETAFALAELFRQLNNLPQAQVWYATAARHIGPRTDEARLNLLELSIIEGDFEAADQLAGSLSGHLTDPAQQELFIGYREQIEAWKTSQISMKKAREEQARLAIEVERLSLEQKRISTDNAQQTEIEAAARLAEEEAARMAVAPPVTSPSDQSAPGPEREGDELAAQGDPKGAAIAYWKAVGQDDSRPDLWLKLTNAYRALREWPEAEACVLEARRRDRQNPDIEIVYLDIVRQTRPYDQFLDEVESSRSRYPQDPDIAIALADALSATGQDTIQAIRAYEDFLLLAPPDDPRRQQAKNSLNRIRGW
jgi:tetratricopeptide (TPR) repeat protein